jgi:hypothetical protein
MRETIAGLIAAGNVAEVFRVRLPSSQTIAIRANGVAARDGRPASPRIEALRAVWLDAGNPSFRGYPTRVLLRPRATSYSDATSLGCNILTRPSNLLCAGSAAGASVKQPRPNQAPQSILAQ